MAKLSDRIFVATYELVTALKALDCKLERDGKATVVVYLDADDFERARFAVLDKRYYSPFKDLSRSDEFQINGIRFRPKRRGG